VIAAALNREGYQTGTGRPWNAQRVQGVRSRHAFERDTRRTPPVRDGMYSIHGVAERLGVSESVVRGWVARGEIQAASGGGQGRPRWFSLDAEALARLGARPRPGSSNNQ